jgi:gamma-polyglutamate synthase
MYFLLILLFVIAYLVVEKVLHDRRVRHIPIRIHVNGTRGKSSVVRLIAEVLRGAGIRTLAKVTGTEPGLIDPDGHEERITRRGPSRIQEQVWFVRRAAKLKVEAIVVECMALDPRLQFASEAKMIKSTIGIITNVRPDHFEVMGKTLDEIAEALSESIPFRGALVTGDAQYFPLFQKECDHRNTKAYWVGEIQSNLDAGEISSTIYGEHLSIVNQVCSLIEKIAPEVRQIPIRAIPEREDANVIEARVNGKTIRLVDAFSANDTESTLILQTKAMSSHGFPRSVVALLNNRADRPLRMLSFASFLSEESSYDEICLVGDLQWLARRVIRRRGSKIPIHLLKGRGEPDGMIKEICERIPSSAFTVVGMGNYKGPGERLIRFFQEKGERAC